LLNRTAVTRLCYCGPVLHTHPAGLHASREPLQFGAEIYGHAGLEAELEIQELAIDSLESLNVGRLTVDLSDMRIVAGVLANVDSDLFALSEICRALTNKDPQALQQCSVKLPSEVRRHLMMLLDLYGGIEVLERAQQCLPPTLQIQAALHDLRWLHTHLKQAFPDVELGFDLADLSGYAYYSGVRFAVYAEGANDALARGGRYDEVGAAFGRRRPAVGFSLLDLKELVTMSPSAVRRLAIRAPWGEEAALRSMIRSLRGQGETVICVLPGHEHELDEFDFDRQLVSESGSWRVVRSTELS
jgi:ATP phosphoribosyltransferase regulatory subunit